MKYTLGFKRTDYAWVEVEAESFEDAKAKAEDVEIDETDWEPDYYFDTELFLITDEKGDEEYYA